jgi:hypothetical protein
MRWHFSKWTGILFFGLSGALSTSSFANSACETHLKTSESASYLFAFITNGFTDEVAGTYNYYGRTQSLQFHLTRSANPLALEIEKLEVLQNGQWSEVPFTFEVALNKSRPIDLVKLSPFTIRTFMGDAKIRFEIWYRRATDEARGPWEIQDVAIKDITEIAN